MSGSHLKQGFPPHLPKWKTLAELLSIHQAFVEVSLQSVPLASLLFSLKPGGFLCMRLVEESSGSLCILRCWSQQGECHQVSAGRWLSTPPLHFDQVMWSREGVNRASAILSCIHLMMGTFSHCLHFSHFQNDILRSIWVPIQFG